MVRGPDDTAESSADLTTLARSSADLTIAAEGVWYVYSRLTATGMTLHVTARQGWLSST